MCLEGMGKGHRCHWTSSSAQYTKAQLASLRSGESGNGLPFQQTSQMFQMDSITFIKAWPDYEESVFTDTYMLTK